MILLIFSFLIFQWCMTFSMGLIYSEKNIKLSILTAFALNLMITSYLFFLSLTLQFHFGWIYFIIAIIFFLVLAAIKKKAVFSVMSFKHLASGFNTKETLFLLILLLFASFGFSEHSTRWGEWDAFTIWNTHAHFLVSDSWQNLFSAKNEWNIHPDYPNMLPSLIAIIWNSLNSISPIIPSFISFIFTVCIILLIWFSMRAKEININLIIISILILLVNYNFMFQAASQYADTALALFFLLSFVSLKLAEGKNPVSFIFIGFIAASCSWIKNEGLVFFLLFSAYILIKHRKFNLLKFYAIGSIIPILFIVYFKLAFAPQNDMVTSQNVILAKMCDPARYLFILKSFYKVFYYDYPILLVSILFLVLKRKLVFLLKSDLIVVIVTFGVYCFAYLITSKDLSWHLITSASRLVHQLYPSIIFILTVFISNWISQSKTSLKQPV